MTGESDGTVHITAVWHPGTGCSYAHLLLALPHLTTACCISDGRCLQLLFPYMYNALDSRLYDLDLENLDSGRGIVMRDCRGVVRVHALQSALLVSGRKRASQGCLSVCLCAAALRPSVSPASLPSALILHVSVRRNILGCAHMQDRCAGGGFLEHAARHVTFSSSEGTGCSSLRLDWVHGE